jgi:hypothetical protein
VGWEQVLKTPGKSVLDLSVSICEGSYSELAEVTNDSILLQCETISGGATLASTTRILGETSPKTITFHDLISREPSVNTLFREITGNEPNAYPGTVLDTGRALQVRLLSDPVAGIASPEKIRSIFKIAADTEIDLESPDARSYVSYYSYRLPHLEGGNYSQECPIVELPRDRDLRYMIAPWPNSGYLSPLLRCFVEAYMIGMLARYFPSLWMRLIRSQKGDASFPLVRQIIRHLKDDFPGLARSELRRFF